MRKKTGQRLLSMLMAILMVISLIPVGSVTAQAEVTGTVYFDNSVADWSSVYIWSSSISEDKYEWHTPVEIESETGYYKFEITNWADDTKVIFTSVNNWTTIDAGDDLRTVQVALSDIINKVTKANSKGSLENKSVYNLSISEYTGSAGAESSEYFYVNTSLIDYYNDQRVDTSDNVAGVDEIYENQGAWTNSWDAPYSALNKWISGLVGYAVPENRIYYNNTYAWAAPVNAYAWTGSTYYLGSWPGTAMTYMGGGIYSIAVSSNAQKVIFNNGSEQTGDLTIAGAGQIYNNDGTWSDYDGKEIYYNNTKNWSTVNAYYWSSADSAMISWPGNAMTSLGNGVYRITVPSDAEYIIFNNGSAKTSDLTIPGGGQIYNNSTWSVYTKTMLPLYFGSLYHQTQLTGVEGGTVNSFYRGANVSFLDNTNAVAQGIVGKNLVDGQLVTSYSDDVLVPFFEKSEEYTDQSKYMTFYDNLQFPFKVKTVNGVTTYSFNSKTDTVYYDYGSNKIEVSDEAVLDVQDEVGFFPFNPSNPVDKSELNYGFGTKFTIPFTVSTNGKDVNGDDVIFSFSGDDDVWVYIDGALVLDMGGAHEMASGTINFATQKATISTGTADARTDYGIYGGNSTYASNGNAEVSFENITVLLSDGSTAKLSDYMTSLDEYGKDRVHTLTMYYMERGMYNSNMAISFSFNPVPSGLVISKDVDTTDVNDGLKSAVENGDEFTFNVSAANLKTEESISFSKFSLTDHNNQSTTVSTSNNVVSGVRADRYASAFLDAEDDEAFMTGTGFVITEDLTKSSFQYSKTVWKLYDADNGYTKLDEGTSTEASFNMGSASDDATKSYNYTINYINTPIVGSVTLTKDWSSTSEAPDTEFDFKVYVDLDGDGTSFDYKKYELTYTINGTSYTADSDGIIKLKAGETAAISGIPVGAKVKVIETPSSGEGWSVDGEAEKAVTVEKDVVNNITITNKAVATTDFLHTDKTVAENEDDTYTLTLEAYVEGNIDEMVVTKPTDIVLVLDHSASMRTPAGAPDILYSGTWYGGEGGFTKDKLDSAKGEKRGYYVAQSSTTNAWFVMEYNASTGKWTGYSVPSTQAIIDTTGGYTEHTMTQNWTYDELPEQLIYYKSQYAMLYDSVYSFIQELQDSGVEHRIAIVGFAGAKTAGTRVYTTFNDSPYVRYTAITSKVTNNDIAGLASVYQNAFKNVQNAKEYSELLTFLEAIDTNYSYTCPSAGIDIANGLYQYNEIDSTERDRMTILFTDGIPNIRISESQIESTTTAKQIYNEIVETAYVSKNTYGAKIFSISTTTLGSGADRTFLKYASSDYPNASSYDSPGSQLDTSKLQYTFEVESDDTLDLVFEAIGSTTATKVQLDETAVLKEVLSNYFKLPDDVEASDIKVYTSAYEGNGKFSETLVPYNAIVTLSSSEENGRLDVINVTNFDYAENYISDSPVKGKKLVVKVPVEVRDGFWGGNNVPTNKKTTAIYEDDLIVKRFPMPEANVPITPVVTTNDKVIYYGGDVTAKELLDKITVSGVEVTVNEDGTFTPAESWMDDYATLSWSEGSMQPQDSYDDKISNKNDDEYPYSVTLTPIYDGNGNESENPSGNAVGEPIESITASSDAEVSILIPVITFEDSTIDLGYKPDQDYYDTNDYVSVTWVDQETWKTTGELVEGTPTDQNAAVPTLSYTYTPETDTFVEDTKVNVSVTSSNVDGNSGVDITSVSVFAWQECENEELHDNGEDIATHGGSIISPEFWIHVNTPYAVPDAVVIDFGLSVDISVLANDSFAPGGTLKAVSANATVENGVTATQEYNDIGVAMKYGQVWTSGNKVRYVPRPTVTEEEAANGYETAMNMSVSETFSYCAEYNGYYYYSTITVIPAANIYYEDNFLNFTDASTAYTEEGDDPKTYGVWEKVESDAWYGQVVITQAEDRPGSAEDGLKDIDADNIYGYDAAYDNCSKFSLGSAYKVTVDPTTGKNSAAPTAAFTFTGTGFDVISLTDNTSGAITVTIYKIAADGTETKLKNYVVNNYYGYTFDPETGEWNATGAGDENALYQIPVIKVEDLDYGQYKVVIKAAYMGTMNLTGQENYYSIWVDAIRIYDPAKGDAVTPMDPVVENAYKQDQEDNADFTTVKKLLVDVDTIYAGSVTAGAMFIDGIEDLNVSTEGLDANAESTMSAVAATYENQGPNNEAYLKAGQAIAFQLVTNQNPFDHNYHIHLGAKLAQGSSAALLLGEEELKTLTTATNMFYDLSDLTWTQDGDENIWRSEVIVLSNHKDSTGIISITDLKVTSENGVIFGTYNSETFGTETNALIASIVTEETLSYGIRTMNTLYVTRDTSEDIDAGDGEGTGSEGTGGEDTGSEDTAGDTDVITPADGADSGNAADNSNNTNKSESIDNAVENEGIANTVTSNNNTGNSDSDINSEDTTNVVIPDLDTEAARRGIIPLPQLRWIAKNGLKLNSYVNVLDSTKSTLMAKSVLVSLNSYILDKMDVIDIEVQTVELTWIEQIVVNIVDWFEKLWDNLFG